MQKNLTPNLNQHQQALVQPTTRFTTCKLTAKRLRLAMALMFAVFSLETMQNL